LAPRSGLNDLITLQTGGQGRARTADLPLFRITDYRARPATEVCLAAQRPAVHAGRRWYT